MMGHIARIGELEEENAKLRKEIEDLKSRISKIEGKKEPVKTERKLLETGV